jgi:putative ABC transport system permease protein
MLLLLILSTGIFVGFRTSSVSTWNSVQQDREDSRLEDASFLYSRPISIEEMESYEKEFDLVMQESVHKDFEVGKATVRVRPVYDELNLYSVVEGKPLLHRGDILVDRFYFTENALSFGESLVIDSEVFKIVGIVSFPDYIGMLENESDLMSNGNAFGLSVVSSEDYQKLSESGEKIYYSVKFSSDGEDAFREALSKNGAVLRWTDAGNSPRVSRFDGEIKAIIIMSSIAPMFILLVSCFTMAVIMGRMLKREYTHIGTLSAMGYRKRELLIHYLLLPAVVSVVGSGIGLLVGYLSAEPMLMISKVEYSIPAVHLDFTTQNMLTALLLPLLLMLTSASLSILYALRLNTVVLLKSNSGKQKRGLLTRLIPHRFGSFRFRFRAKELLSNLPRGFLMIAGICVSATFLFAGILIYTSIETFKTESFDKVYTYEYQYVFTAMSPKNPSEGEPFMAASFDVKSEGNLGITIVGIEDNSKYVQLKDLDGKEISLEKTIVSHSVSDRLKLAVGDRITITSRSDAKEYVLTVGAIADSDLGESIYMKRATLNKMLDLPEETHIGVYSDTKIDFPEGIVASDTTRAEALEGMNATVGFMSNFLFILSGVAMVIGVVVIYIVTLLLISENSKSISMLKVMGYHNGEISSLLTRSNIVPVLIGFAISIPLATQIMGMFFEELTSGMYAIFYLELGWPEIAAALTFILTVYFLTLIPTRRKILAIRLSDSLKGRE